MSGTATEIELDAIELDPLDDLDLGPWGDTPGTPPEPEKEPTTQTDPGIPGIWDIETGPRPWAEIEQFYVPPPPLPPWSEDMVKYGNLKDQAKRIEKYNAVRAEYEDRMKNDAENRAVHRGAWLSDCALDPVTGQVLAIGYLRGETGVIDHVAAGGEARLLENFWGTWWDSAKRNSAPMIGFNIHGFDLPFLVRRSWLLNVEVPGDVLPDGRYWSRLFVDLMVKWNFGQRAFVKLDRVAAYFGGPRKSGSGADFARLYLEDQVAALKYLEQDLRVTADVARRMGVI